MELFDGKKVANKILKETAERIKKTRLKPGLAVILVGHNAASEIYVRLKKEAAKKVGINFFEFKFNENVQEEEIIEKINELNAREDINGIIVQLPLPAVLNQDKIMEVVSPRKDVDGFHPQNRRALAKGEAVLAPVLPTAILAAAKEADKRLVGKKVLALVNSEVLGQALKMFFENEEADFAYQVRNVCLIAGAEKAINQADILISVCGCPNLIKGELIKQGAILIDAGITRYTDGRIIGDVDMASVRNKASFLTPTPGGIGPLTVALLLRNVYLAVNRRD
ncbi:MAG: Bifunctional protein FolD [Parcubacteria group bacterium GW2011_GWF2_44_7]|nr:MAG: Bifunctional protein FolD [Parcubacteria group bacterium GW2011_GWF2_44_7]